MTLTVTNTVDVNEYEIIEDFNLTSESCRYNISDAVNDYICGLDDYEFFLLGAEEERLITDRIATILGVDK